MRFWVVGLFAHGRSLRGESIARTALIDLVWARTDGVLCISVQGFLTFMSGYTVFLGPFAGIMIADYYIVHRCRVDVPAMYDPHGRYRYTSGVVSAVPPH